MSVFLLGTDNHFVILMISHFCYQLNLPILDMDTFKKKILDKDANTFKLFKKCSIFHREENVQIILIGSKHTNLYIANGYIS